MSKRLTLAVEHPTQLISVVYVTGGLDRLASPRLARLLDAQLDRCLARDRTRNGKAHLVVDLSGVSVFGPGGLSVLRHAQYTAQMAGVGFALTGLTARAGLLPEWTRDVVARFDGFPTVETALAALERSRAAERTPTRLIHQVNGFPQKGDRDAFG